jgi:hypothetical protein
MDFAAQPPDLRRLTLGREGFAVLCPLALVDAALYPVLVHRLAASLPASFSAGLAAGPVSRLAALRFVWVAATNSPGDFHPLSIPMLSTQRIRAGLANRPFPGAVATFLVMLPYRIGKEDLDVKKNFLKIFY